MNIVHFDLSLGLYIVQKSMFATFYAAKQVHGGGVSAINVQIRVVEDG